MPFASHSRFNCRWSLAFLTPFLHVFYSYWVTWAFLQLLIVSFLCPTFARSYLFTQAGASCYLCLTSFMLRWTVLEVGGCDPWKSINSPWPLYLQGCIPWDSSKQVTEQSKVCFPEVQCCDPAFSLFFPAGILNAIISWSLQPRMLPAFTSLLSSSMFVSRASPLTGFWITCQEVISAVQKPPDCLCAAALSLQQTIEVTSQPQPGAWSPQWEPGPVNVRLLLDIFVCKNLS